MLTLITSLLLYFVFVTGRRGALIMDDLSWVFNKNLNNKKKNLKKTITNGNRPEH